jgi:hypothetical protein
VANDSTALEGLQQSVAEALGGGTRTPRVRLGVLRLLGAVADGASRISSKHIPLNGKPVEQLLDSKPIIH